MDSFPYFARKCLYIRDKPGNIIPFKLNDAQIYIHSKLEKQREETGKVRALILKGRQQGASTYIEARLLWRVLFSVGKRAFILTHEAEATKNLFKMAKLYVEKMPSVMTPTIGADSANELTIPNLNASYRVGTAGNKSVGRSETIQLFHGSESAFWPHADEHAKGILQAIPDEPGTEVIIESTANGPNGWFYQQVQAALRGEGEYQIIFTPWFWQKEYRKTVPDNFSLTQIELEIKKSYTLDDEQIMFRRAKIVELSASGGDGEAAFMQEYPMTIEEAFSRSRDRQLIPANIVNRAMKSTLTEGYGPVVMGVDPASEGGDRAVIVVRQGRYIKDIIMRRYIKTTDFTGLIKRTIKKYKPTRVNIDKGTFGKMMIDTLHDDRYEMVYGVDFGGSAAESDKYYNKRTEMWCKLKLWLDDEPVMLPDRDDILMDLTEATYGYDVHGRIKLDSKSNFKMSTDLGDALGLTLAEEINEWDNDDYSTDGFVAADSRIGI